MSFLSYNYIFSPPPPAARPRHSDSAGTSALSIWLSVDPMSDKYPSMSPYTLFPYSSLQA